MLIRLPKNRFALPASPAWGLAWLLLGAALCALSLQTVLADGQTAATLVSVELWQRLVDALGGDVLPRVDGALLAEVGWGPLFALAAAVSLGCWLLGAGWISFRTKQPYARSLGEWGVRGWAWWLLPGAWEGLRIAAFLTGFEQLEALLLATPPFWYALMLAGWLATFCTLSTDAAYGTRDPVSRIPEPGFRIPTAVWVAAGVYAAVFTAMNWQLYRGLLVPHGDSAMYEEHLWNLLHGKGFRSYLDQGLFLGERIQVAHVLLLPLYVLWPSHLLLELCESLALASGAVPVYWLARRHTGSTQAGVLLACAYLLYFPMQFLDISIDGKTFRPGAFGIPLLLFALDQLERGRYRSMIALLLLALTAQEDTAIVIAMLGAWLAVAGWRSQEREGTGRTGEHRRDSPSPPRRTGLIALGAGMAVFGAVYLLAAFQAIRWFRGGEVHYVSYFSKFGDSLGEIAWTMLTDPGLLFGELFTSGTLMFAVSLLLPIGFLPLLSPGRLAVGLPLFGLLCLNELAQDPRHHFHAPLVAIVFWAAAAGVGRWSDRETGKPRDGEIGRRENGAEGRVRRWMTHFGWTSALFTGVFFSLGPLGAAFWDPGSAWHWRAQYVPGKRAELFPRVFEQIPRSARVFSTDFVHPRFTHHARSYDYSDYPRPSDAELRNPVPGVEYFIVIDTRHRYSSLRKPEDVPEYRENPEEWELLPDTSDGFFIVLRRRPSDFSG